MILSLVILRFYLTSIQELGNSESSTSSDLSESDDFTSANISSSESTSGTWSSSSNSGIHKSTTSTVFQNRIMTNIIIIREMTTYLFHDRCPRVLELLQTMPSQSALL